MSGEQYSFKLSPIFTLNIIHCVDYGGVHDTFRCELLKETQLIYNSDCKAYRGYNKISDENKKEIYDDEIKNTANEIANIIVENSVLDEQRKIAKDVTNSNEIIDMILTAIVYNVKMFDPNYEPPVILSRNDVRKKDIKIMIGDYDKKNNAREAKIAKQKKAKEEQKEKDKRDFEKSFGDETGDNKGLSTEDYGQNHRTPYIRNTLEQTGNVLQNTATAANQSVEQFTKFLKTRARKGTGAVKKIVGIRPTGRDERRTVQGGKRKTARRGKRKTARRGKHKITRRRKHKR